MNKRIHNSRKPLQLDRSRCYEQADHFKPNGLWYGFGDSWQEWCKGEMPTWIHRHFYEIEPNGSKLLTLETEDDMLWFNQEYDGKPLLPGIEFTRQIAWERIAHRYDGIEIPFYFYKFRLHRDFLWYYAWDVASGCIWRLDKIEVTKL